MNDSKASPEDIRSDINQTRQRMDDTIDTLAERLKPQHLVDELLGLLRRPGKDGESHLADIRDKVTQSADTAMHAVVDTVKKNPVPALLIGAGIAWMIYESRRSDTKVPSADGDYYGYDRDGDPTYDPDVYQDRPLRYPDRPVEEGETKLGELKDKIADKASTVTERAKEKLSNAGEAAKEKMSRLGEVAREKASAIGEQASEKFQQVKASAGRAYDRTKEKVANTADEHPLEVGFACLAAGVIAGLVIPTPGPVNRRLGPAAERLRDRTREAGRDMMAKGRQVADAAVSAAKQEAKAQGLTPEALAEQASDDSEGQHSAIGSPEKPQNQAGVTEATQSGP